MALIRAGALVSIYEQRDASSVWCSNSRMSVTPQTIRLVFITSQMLR